MSLLAPLALLGLLGLALPILAHLLGREPPRKVRFSAMRFLVQPEQSVTHRRAVHDLPLLLVRLALLALLVLVLARPASRDAADLAVVAEPHDAIVLVDSSRSMGLVVDDKTLLSHAVERAEMLSESLPGGSRVGLVTSDPDGPRLEASAATDRIATALGDWVAAGAPRPGAWSLPDALPLAIELLGEPVGDRPRVVYAVGDGTAAGLAGLPSVAEGGVLIVPIPAVDPDNERPEHVAIERVEWESAPELDPRAVRIRAVLQRHDGEPASTRGDEQVVTVALRHAGEEIGRATAELPVDEEVVVEFTHTFAGEGLAVPLEIALVDHGDDPLHSDDVRHLWLVPDEGIDVVVVNGDPSELRAHDEVYFLVTALAAAAPAARIRVSGLAPDQLEQRIREQGVAALAHHDVLVLANVRAPAQDVARPIIERVRAGMGLWIAMGDRVEVEAYNARFGPVLPLGLREVVRVGTAPGRAEARVEGIAPADLHHPAFRNVDGDLGLGGTRARTIVLCEPDPRRDAEIALSYTSGAPALLTRDVGAGRVGLLTTTLDRDWSDLPLRPGFVPMVAAVLQYLGGRHADSAPRVWAGEPRVMPASGALVVHTPSGREIALDPRDDGTAILRDTLEVGHYEVVAGEATTRFAVEVDPRESDTRWSTLPDGPLEDGAELTGERAVTIATPKWRTLVLFAALLLLIETTLRWRARRRG